MWPLPPTKNELISITANPQHIACSWIKRSRKKPLLELRAYKRMPLQHLELEKLILFNPTKIKKFITNFVHTYNLEHAFAALALRGPGIVEHFVPHASTTSTDNLIPANQRKHMHWQHTYAYPYEDASIFYVCGIQQPILLQYQLLAIATGLNLLSITTERMALLNVYKHMYGSAFRHAQLGLDMVRHNNMIEQVFAHNALARMLHIPAHINVNINKQTSHLLTASGLFIAQGNTL